MSSVLIESNDVFEELAEENDRLLNELIFAENCLKMFIEFKTFIELILDKNSIALNDKQRYEELKNDIDNSLSHRSVLSSLKSENTENESNFYQQFNDHFEDNITEFESSEQELPFSDEILAIRQEVVNTSTENTSNRSPYKAKESFKTYFRQKYGRRKASNKLFVCPVFACKYSSDIRKNYLTHKQIHSEKKFECSHPGCDYRSYKKSITDRHMKRMHSSRKERQENTNTSDKINSNGSTNKTKKSFKTSKLGKSGQTVVSKKLFVCPVDGCEYRSYVRKWFTNHKWRIHSEKKIKCSYSGCDYRSTMKCNIRRHVKRKHLSEVVESIPGLSTDLFKCDFEGCSFVTYRSKAFSVHKSTHLDKKFKCPHSRCDYTSVDKRMTYHLRTVHRSQQEEQFECPHSGCDFKHFRNEMRQHLRRVHMKCDKERTISEQYIRDHLLSKRKTKFVCHYEGCGTKFSCYYRLNQHINKRHTKELLKCEYQGCDYSDTNPLKLQNHLTIRHLEKTLKCDYPGCSYSTALQKYLTQHTKIHSEYKPWACDWPGCEYRATKKSNLTDHMKIHTNTNTKEQYKCPFDGCDKTFKWKQSFINHKQSIHIRSQEYSCECPGCEYKTYNRKMMLNHKLFHTDDKPIECDWPGCEFNSFNRQTMLNHRIVHSDDKPFACHWPGCQYRTKMKHSLKLHMERHTGPEGQYKCPFDGCDKAFKTTITLSRHIKRNHDKSQEYSCEWPGCEYKAYSNQTIAKHRITHSNDKPYACEWPGCQFRTKYKQCMSNHNKRHK